MKTKKRIFSFLLSILMILCNIPSNIVVAAEVPTGSQTDVYATQSSDFTISIPKQLILDGKTGSGAYRVAVKGNIAGLDIITVKPDVSFYMSQEGKSDILTIISQPKTDFCYADGLRPDKAVTADGLITMSSISAGKWGGIFNFNITSSVDVEAKDSLGSTEEDINNDVKDGIDIYQNQYSEYITNGVSKDVLVNAKDEEQSMVEASSSSIVGTVAETLLDKLSESGLVHGNTQLMMFGMAKRGFTNTIEVDTVLDFKSEDFDDIATAIFNVRDVSSIGDTVVILYFNEETREWEHIITAEVNDNYLIECDFSKGTTPFVKVDENGNITSHIHNIKTTTINPTCIEDGKTIYTCPCGYETVESIGKLGHNHVATITAPTCTDRGYTTHVCSRCNDTYVNAYVNALGHTIVNGGTYDIHKKCSVCDIVIENTHSMNNKVTTEPNCTTTGIRTYTCNCGYSYEETIQELGHNYKSVITNPTCVDGGYTTHTCLRCNDTYKDAYTNAKGHVSINAGTSSVHKKCSVCDVTLENTHTYTNSITTQPTCTTTGIRTYTCDCGYKYTETVDALGHTIVNGGTLYAHTKCNICDDIISSTHNYSDSVTTKPTCTTAGVRTYTCDCGYKYTESINALGHTTVNGGVSNIHTKCSTCGATLSSEHNYTNRVTTQPTCTTNGVRTYTCGCGYSYTESVNALGHTSVNGATASIHTKCSTCGTTLSSTHSFTNSVTTQPTCTTDGVKTYTCGCGYKYTETVAKLGHNYSSAVTAPTCTAQGYTTYNCARCGNTYKDNYTNAKGHVEVNGGTSGVHKKCSTCGVTLSTSHNYTNAITTQPTCTATGIRTYTCGCGYKYTETVAAKGHTSVNGGTSGVHTKCSTCGATLSTAHSYTNAITTQPTCTATGIRTYTCGCGYKYTETVAAKGHTSVNGGTSGVHTKCSTCGATLSTAHSYTKSTQTAATCTVKGTSKYTCSCGYYYTSQDIAALGHKSVNGGIASAHTKCSTCGVALTTNHSYSLTAQSATAGTKTYSCACGYQYNDYYIDYTVTGWGGQYDGSYHGITVKVNTTGCTVKYGTTAGNYTTTTNPTYKTSGSYSVYYQITKSGYPTVTGVAEVVIRKAASSTVKELSTGNFNVLGSGSIQTTYSGNGYATRYKIDDTEYELNALSATQGDITITRNTSTVNDYGRVVTTYTIKNNGTSAHTICVGVNADIYVYSNDSAPIYKSDYGVYAKSTYTFAYYLKNTSGVNNVDTIWFGRYSERVSNQWKNTSSSSLSNTDSGLSFSWLNRVVQPGQTITLTWGMDMI